MPAINTHNILTYISQQDAIRTYKDFLRIAKEYKTSTTAEKKKLESLIEQLTNSIEYRKNSSRTRFFSCKKRIICPLHNNIQQLQYITKLDAYLTTYPASLTHYRHHLTLTIDLWHQSNMRYGLWVAKQTKVIKQCRQFFYKSIKKQNIISIIAGIKSLEFGKKGNNPHYHIIIETPQPIVQTAKHRLIKLRFTAIRRILRTDTSIPRAILSTSIKDKPIIPTENESLPQHLAHTLSYITKYEQRDCHATLTLYIRWVSSRSCEMLWLLRTIKLPAPTATSSHAKPLPTYPRTRVIGGCDLSHTINDIIKD